MSDSESFTQLMRANKLLDMFHDAVAELSRVVGAGTSAEDTACSKAQVLGCLNTITHDLRESRVNSDLLVVCLSEDTASVLASSIVSVDVQAPRASAAVSGSYTEGHYTPAPNDIGWRVSVKTSAPSYTISCADRKDAALACAHRIITDWHAGLREWVKLESMRSDFKKDT